MCCRGGGNMNQETDIRIEQLSAITLFDIRGDLTAASEPIFRKAYESAGGQALQGILLKFEPAAYINSGGIAVLIQLLARSRQSNQKVAITGISDHFKKIFTMVGITKLAKIYDSAEEAVSAVSGGS